MIKEVLEHYFPHWAAPHDDGREWIPTECPVHAETNPSASVSYENGAFNCHSCGYKGDFYTVIMREEEVPFGEAVRVAEAIAEKCSIEVPPSHYQQPSRRVSKPARFGEL